MEILVKIDIDGNVKVDAKNVPKISLDRNVNWLKGLGNVTDIQSKPDHHANQKVSNHDQK